MFGQYKKANKIEILLLNFFLLLPLFVSFKPYNSGSQTFCDATHLKKLARLCDAPDSIPRFSLPYCEINVTHNVQITVLMKPRFWIGLLSSIVKLRSSKLVTQLVIFHVFVKHTTECFILNIFFAN